MNSSDWVKDCLRDFPGGPVAKNLPASAGYTGLTSGLGGSQLPGSSDGKAPTCNERDPGLIPRSGRSSGEGNVTHSSTGAWKFPWTEEPGRLQSLGSQRVKHNWATSLSFQGFILCLWSSLCIFLLYISKEMESFFLKILWESQI